MLKSNPAYVTLDICSLNFVWIFLNNPGVFGFRSISYTVILKYLCLAKKANNKRAQLSINIEQAREFCPITLLVRSFAISPLCASIKGYKPRGEVHTHMHTSILI